MEQRKYYLDWLRVSAFGFLILFHVGMLYVTWPFNLKSARIVPALEPWMTALGAWRLALLFFISGVAANFLITRLGPGAFARDRLRRLLPVILFAMFVVIPPQVYVEFRSKGAIAPGYLHFWLFSYLPADQTLAHHFGRTFPTWDHLWFVVYLLAYTLVLAAIFGVAQRLGRLEGRPIPLLAALLAPAAWMAVTNLFILKVA
ncbi:MAG TPA: acyltransferase family protein, partial [Acetobacteraceae bacterium]|nr:acyltransferase family protein [Acetobacteraceae bacterium]